MNDLDRKNNDRKNLKKHKNLWLRQKALFYRLCRIAVEDPRTIAVEWKESGVGRNSFLIFSNQSKVLSRLTLNKLERYILQREEELGL